MTTTVFCHLDNGMIGLIPHKSWINLCTFSCICAVLSRYKPSNWLNLHPKQMSTSMIQKPQKREACGFTAL